jgi:hypothetical protein
VNVVDELGRLIQAEPKARELVSAHIANVISDLSVVCEALRQLQVYKGQLVELPAFDKDENGELTKELNVPWAKALKDIESLIPEEFYNHGIPAQGRFHYPVDKRRTKEKHEAMRASEHNLDAFWRAMDANMERKRQWTPERL